MLTRPTAVERVRSLRRQMADDRGITLADLMVAMALTAILGTMAILFFVPTTHLGYKTVLTNQNTGDARLTLDEWTGMLRMAGWLDPNTKVDRFEEVTPTKIVFYANLGNRSSSSSSQVDSTTKIALVLRISDTVTGRGQLIEVRFASDNTTVKSVRQLGMLASKTNGAPVFQPYSRGGSAIDMTQTGCLSGSTPTAGLCLQTPQTGAGMQDPTVAASGLAVAAGSRTGNPALNVDRTLGLIGSVGIAVTLVDPSGTATTDYTSLASVSSGFPS